MRKETAAFRCIEPKGWSYKISFDEGFHGLTILDVDKQTTAALSDMKFSEEQYLRLADNPGRVIILGETADIELAVTDVDVKLTYVGQQAVDFAEPYEVFCQISRESFRLALHQLREMTA